MKLATLRSQRGHAPALVASDGVVALADVARAAGSTLPVADEMSELLAGYGAQSGELKRLAALLPELLVQGSVEPSSADLGPPVPRPGKIIGVGLNYADHARETGQAAPSIPVVFAKFGTTIVGPGDLIVRPAEVQDLDYEAELAVVIGRRTRSVTKAAALDHVLGYMNANDVSARTAQLATGQWVLGKSFDTFCPVGPYLVTPDECTDVQDLAIRCWVDGEIRQESSTAEMIFGVADLVAYLSTSMTLEPGDIILTGTPPGVAMARNPPPWLQPGQRCDIEIGPLGRLSNAVEDGGTQT
jgi:2-keto-4-pentenoate hydratase/2-oxohepta-3-ene-1,7-dioic acid hydratase in catechol pathway